MNLDAIFRRAAGAPKTPRRDYVQSLQPHEIARPAKGPWRIPGHARRIFRALQKKHAKRRATIAP